METLLPNNWGILHYFRLLIISEKNDLIQFFSGLDPRIVLKYCLSHPSLGKWELATKMIEKKSRATPGFPRLGLTASAGLHNDDLGFVF